MARPAKRSGRRQRKVQTRSQSRQRTIANSTSSDISSVEPTSVSKHYDSEPHDDTGHDADRSASDSSTTVVTPPVKAITKTPAKKSTRKKTDLRLFPCTEPGCGKSFKRSDHLLRHHSSVHIAEKKFPCIKCDYKATRKDNLVQHLEQKHHMSKSRAHSVAQNGQVEKGVVEKNQEDEKISPSPSDIERAERLFAAALTIANESDSEDDDDLIWDDDLSLGELIVLNMK